MGSGVELELERAKVIKLSGNTYTLKYPTIGQVVDIETWKLTISKGKYLQMVGAGNLKAMEEALDYVDMCSYFLVLCPDLIRDAKVDLTSLDTLDSVEIMDVYKTQFVPWWNNYLKAVRPEKKEEKKEDDES